MNAPGDLHAVESTGEFDIGSPILGGAGMSYLPFMAIGEGGMARVLLAKAKGPGGFEKLVVLKTIRRDALDNPQVRKLFVDEAKLCAQLNHPNLVQVHDVDLDAESPCLVMEYLEGKTLQEILRGRVLTEVMLLTVCSEVLAGLHYAHELRDFGGQLMNVVHRDVSPHNLFVTYDGSAKVLDFGIAKMAGAVSDAVTEDVKGKLSYMAPEQLLGNQVDRRADVFAMGVLLWEIAVGKRMWDGLREPVLMHRLATGQIPEIPPDAPIEPQLAAIIAKATAAEPDERYATALELRSDLDAYISSKGRRPPMREVGERLAVEFAEDRDRTASRIRIALEKRSIPPPPPQEEPQEKPSRKGGIVLLLVSALAAGAIVWGFSGRTTAEVHSSRPELSSAPPTHADPSGDPPSGAEPGSSDATSSGSRAGGAELAGGIGPAGALGEGGRGGRSRDAADASGDGERASVPSKTSGARTEQAQSSSGSRAGRASARRRTSAASAPRRTTAPAPAPASAPTAREVDCDPPYFFKDGIKSYRPECL